MKTHTMIFSIVTVLVLCLPFSLLWASETRSIYILPFQVIGSDSSETMQNVAAALLNSRLASVTCPIKRIPAEKEKGPVPAFPSPAEARTLIDTLDGDFLIYGSIISFKDSLTTDAFLFDRAKEAIRIHYHNIGKGDDALLAHLTGFTDQVLTALSEPCFPAEHSKVQASGSLSEAPVLSKTSLWKSPPINQEIIGLTVCDLDADGKPDVICAHENSLSVYRLSDQTMEFKGSYDLSRRHHILGVDAADVDGNKRPEIYLSVVADDRKTLQSMILEWEGGSFRVLRSDLPMVFRSIIRPQAMGSTVLAQKNMNLSSLLGGEVQLFDYTQDTPKAESTIPLPSETASLYSFSPSSPGSGSPYAVYTFNHHLKVYDRTRGLQWESDEDYGGSDRFLAKSDAHDKDKTLYLYLEPRMVFIDPDHDGTYEIATVQNMETANNLFSALRNFSKGRIVILKQNDLGLTKVFQTDNVSGFVSDFTFYSITKDKNPDLIYAVTQGGKGLFSNKTSFIVVQTWTTSTQ